MDEISQSDWEVFIETGQLPASENWRLASWVKSREAGVNPQTPLPAAPIPPAPQTGAFHKHLCFLGDQMAQSIQGAQLAWVFCDPALTVVSRYGQNQHWGQRLDAMGLTVGASLAEDQAGTNSVSLARQSGSWATCKYFDHFKQALHGLFSFATPLFDISGERKGYLMLAAHIPRGLSHQDEWSHRQMLKGLVVLFVQSLDRELRLDRSKRAHNQARKTFRLLCEDYTVPTVLVSTNGFIRQCNPAAYEWLGISDKIQGEKNLDKVAEFSPRIEDIAKSAQPYKEKQMTIKLKDKTLEVVYAKQPFYDENDTFVGVMLRFYESRTLSEEESSSANEARYTFSDILAETPILKDAKTLALKAAAMPVDVLLTGESGTGKEVFAQSIHNASARGQGPFITINCAAVPKEIAESEFFGYSSGAFTGAKKGGSTGKVEAATGGTLFLDEIGDMPYELQAKLLRVLENRTITRVGDTQERAIDIRVVAATNQDLQALIARGEFREDLYYRIAATTIALPSLSESKANLPALAEGFLETFIEQMGKRPKNIDPKVMEAFDNYAWPGNVRELRNAIQFAAMVIAEEPCVGFEHLPGPLRMALLYQMAQEPQDPLEKERTELENSEKAMFKKALTMAGGKVSEAVKILGISRATYYRKVKKFENIS